MNICAPHKYDATHKTCFTIDQLVEMAKAYNRYISKQKLHPNKSINYDTTLIKIEPDKSYLLKELHSRFQMVCNGADICLTKQNFMNEIVKEMREDILNDTFRPNGPDDSKAWLSTAHINEIMQQYEKVYPDFKFLGAVPSDCSDLTFCSLYKLDFHQYQKQSINKLGIIFNLDQHWQPGSHWVALYIDIKKGEIYFCDSMGHKPLTKIVTIIKQFQAYCKQHLEKEAIYEYNKTAYQTDGSECGIYACNFIIRKLAGETFDNIVSHPLTFSQINSCRNVYFSNHPSKYKSHIKCDP